MRNLQTIEGLGAHTFMTPLLAVTLGGTLLVGGCSKNNESVENAAVEPTAVATAAAQIGVSNTITGRIQTLAGEPVAVRDGPFGSETGEYRDDSVVQILCQSPGADAPGKPADFSKPPASDTTWYRLADPESKQPFVPERWIPQNPVFTTDPIPSCPR